MAEHDLDDVDRAILRALQRDARQTNAAISGVVGVSASTVGNRLDRLEDSGVLRGYRPQVDYELAGFPLQVLFVCTAPVTQRDALVEEVLGIEGVVSVRALMTGRENVHVQAVGDSNDDITRIAHDVDALGLAIDDETLLKTERTRPSVRFRPTEPD